MAGDILPALLDMSRTEPGSLTRRLTERLRSLIADGRLATGYRLPSSRALAAALGISRNTVIPVIEQLTAEGYLTLSRNRPPVVSAGGRLRKPHLSKASASPSRIQPRMSSWARGLAMSGWPPVYPERPRAFRPGLSDEREFPNEIWGRCLRHAAGRPLGSGDLATNDPLLREVLLAHLTTHRGLRAEPDQIVILPTAQAAVTLVAKVVVEPGDVAWIESPGYGGAVAALRAAGAEVVGVPLDRNGLRPPGDGTAPRIVFVTPSHQYPTGGLMPVGRRLELLRSAERMGAAIVEDDYDGDFHFEGRPVAALAGIDVGATVFYVGTFSKVMAAGIRVGYVVVPKPLVAAFAAAQRHLGLLVPTGIQAALAEFIGRGAYLSHIRRMTRLYRERRNRLVAALATEAGSSLSVDVPAGGMQLLARCDPSLDDVAICRDLLDAGVTARPLSEMLYHRTDQRGLFLGFAAWQEEEIAAGAAVVGRVLTAAALKRWQA